MSLRARSRFDASNLCYIKDKLIEYHSCIRDATTYIYIPRYYLGNEHPVFADGDRKMQSQRADPPVSKMENF